MQGSWKGAKEGEKEIKGTKTQGRNKKLSRQWNCWDRREYGREFWEAEVTCRLSDLSEKHQLQLARETRKKYDYNYMHIYIVIPRQTVSLYYNSSVWQETRYATRLHNPVFPTISLIALGEMDKYMAFSSVWSDRELLDLSLISVRRLQCPCL